MQHQPINGADLVTCGITASEIKAHSISLSIEEKPLPHYPITGARTLNQTEIDLINKIKAKGDEMYALIKEVHDLHRTEISRYREGLTDPVAMRELSRLVSEGQHWRGRATDSLQDGVMQLVRAIDRRTSFG